MKFIVILFITLASTCGDRSKTSSVQQPIDSSALPSHMDVAFYNVENLFDTDDDPRKNDDDFTPEGRNEWTQGRYERKLQQLSKVIQAMDHGEGLPAVIGLSEVENEAVVIDLANTILPNGYGVVCENGLDGRGIDVALIYRKDLISEISHKVHRIKFTNSGYTSRDILYFEALIGGTETMHFFVNHWPSRREGQAESEHRRLSAAKTLKEAIDDVTDADPEAEIIILGDFNDYPDDKSILKVLGAKPTDGKKKGELVNLAYDLNAQDLGTYNYRGDWGMLDQAIVSDALFIKDGLYVESDGLDIFREDFMMYFDKKYKESKPSSTYSGPKYYGGYSDHLPILLHFEKAN